jgi:hypothetical protein
MMCTIWAGTVSDPKLVLVGVGNEVFKKYGRPHKKKAIIARAIPPAITKKTVRLFFIYFSKSASLLRLPKNHSLFNEQPGIILLWSNF